MKIQYHWQLDVYKLSVEAGAAETQVWIEYSVKCKYINKVAGRKLHEKYDIIISKLVNMGNNPNQWIITPKRQ